MMYYVQLFRMFIDNLHVFENIIIIEIKLDIVLL